MDGKRRIMVVDDDRTHLDMAEEVIGDCYDVTLAASGEQALDILRRGAAPDLILLDIDMPGMNGYETFTRIRDMDADIPVVFLTGLPGSEAELTGLSLGAQDYITKPFVRENLLARIRLRLEGGLQTRRLRDMREQLRDTGIDEERFNALIPRLTPAEQETARLILQGCGNPEIASRLKYSPGYVKNLATSVYDKMGVRSRGELRMMFRKPG